MFFCGWFKMIKLIFYSFFKTHETHYFYSTRGFQQELDCRNDRYERIVKLSRDITIDSKRVIFLLQRVTGLVHVQ